MVTDAAYYAQVVETIMDGIEALDPTGYQWSSSDGWTQARFVDGTRGGSQHLEAWLTLGDAVLIERSHIRHAAMLVFSARYVADDDAIAQARAHAAARAAVDHLLTWRGAYDERVIPSGYRVEPISEDWLVVTISMHILLPRG